MNATAGRISPRLLGIAIIAAALILPLLFLIDRTAVSCGDGLQTFWPSVLAYAGCALASLACLVGGLVRGERPRSLALIPPVLLCVPVVMLAI